MGWGGEGIFSPYKNKFWFKELKIIKIDHKKESWSIFKTTNRYIIIFIKNANDLKGHSHLFKKAILQISYFKDYWFFPLSKKTINVTTHTSNSPSLWLSQPM